MPKEIKDMTIVELVEEFESSVVKAEKYIYSGLHSKSNEARARARLAKGMLLGQFDFLKGELDAANRRFVDGAARGE